MTVAFVVLWAFAVASTIGSAFYATRHVAATFERRLAEQDALEEGRRVALYKQQKESQRVIAQQQRALEILANQSRALHDEARLAHQRVDQHFAHPAIKRITNSEEVS